MKSSLIDYAIAASVQETLEKMFFVGGAQEAAGDAPRQRAIAARLSFEGAPPGWLALRVSSATARSIAADFLGEDELSLSDSRIGEVVLELANMICGAVLSRVETTTEFRLGSPCLEPEKDDAPLLPHRFEVAGGLIEVALEMEQPACILRPNSAS